MRRFPKNRINRRQVLNPAGAVFPARLAYRDSFGARKLGAAAHKGVYIIHRYISRHFQCEVIAHKVPTLAGYAAAEDLGVPAFQLVAQKRVKAAVVMHREAQAVCRERVGSYSEAVHYKLEDGYQHRDKYADAVHSAAEGQPYPGRGPDPGRRCQAFHCVPVFEDNTSRESLFR